MSDAVIPSDLTTIDAEGLRLAANRAGGVVTGMLEVFGEPGDDEMMYWKLATVALELRADAMPALVGHPDLREAFIQRAWRIVERRLPAIIARKVAAP